MAQRELHGGNRKEDLAGKLWANVCYCILSPKAPGTALSHITGCIKLIYVKRRRTGLTGSRSPVRALTLNPPVVLISVLHISGFLLCLSSLLLCIWLSQSMCLGPCLMLLYFSVRRILAQCFCLQNRCPYRKYVLLLPFALRCMPPESQWLCLTWQCGICSALEQQLLLSCLVFALWWPHPIRHCSMLQKSHHGCADLLNKELLGHYSSVKHDLN